VAQISRARFIEGCVIAVVAMFAQRDANKEKQKAAQQNDSGPKGAA